MLCHTGYGAEPGLGEYSLIFVEMNTTQEYGGQKIPVFLVAKGDQILTGDGSPLKLTTGDMVTHPGGRQYPRELDFHWQGIEGTRSLTIAPARANRSR